MNRRPSVILDGADLDALEKVWDRDRPGRAIPFPAPPAPPAPHHPSGGPIPRRSAALPRRDLAGIRAALSAGLRAARRMDSDEALDDLVDVLVERVAGL